MKKLKKISTLVILFVTLVQFTAMGQDEPVENSGPPDPEDTPIDGGLAILLAAGAIYGVKKYRESTGNNEENIAELAV